MNVTVNIDCTPEEARRFMGLPDLTSVHEAYVGKLRSMVQDGVSADTVETLMRSWSPLGEVGLTFWNKLFEQMSQAGFSTK